MDLQLKFTGSAELQRGLDALAFDMAQKARVNAVRAGARVVLAEAQATAPVGESGRFKSAHKVVGEKTDDVKEGAVAHIVVAPGKNKKDPRGAYYGRFVEEGTKSMSGVHTLARALSSKGQAALDALAESLARSIKRFSR